MIPNEYLDILIEWSERNEDLELVLKDNAPESVRKIAEQFFWKPFDIQNGVKVNG